MRLKQGLLLWLFALGFTASVQGASTVPPNRNDIQPTQPQDGSDLRALNAAPLQSNPDSSPKSAPVVDLPVPPGKPRVEKKKISKRKQTGDALIARRGAREIDRAIVGEAQTLPEKVVRARYLLRAIQSDKGYDSSGGEIHSGAHLQATGHAFVLEYGITDRWSLQFIAPFVGRSDLGIDADAFRGSAAYAKQFQKFVDAVVPTLISKGLCASPEECGNAIRNGLALGVSTPIELPTGEIANVAANVPIRSAIDSVLFRALEPSPGRTGLGDLQFGLGYNVYQSTLQIFTAGLGLRVPTGHFTDVPDAYRAPGTGFLAGGLLLKYDLIFKPLVLSLSQQMELSLNSARRNRSSLLDPTRLNSADPTRDDTGIAGAGDGVANKRTIERKGIYHLGFARLAYGLGSLHRILRAGGLYAYYGWSVDPEYHSEGQLYSKKQELYTVSYAFSIDGLALDPVFPASFTYRRELPVGGRNALLAATSDFYQMNFYFKF